MDRISDVVPDRRRCLLVNARTDEVPPQLRVMCNTWPVNNVDGTVLVFEEDGSAEGVTQIAWEKLAGRLDELLEYFCSKIELVNSSNNGMNLGVMKLHLKRGVTRITILNWMLKKLGIPAEWNERYTTDHEPADTSDRINEELTTRFTQLLFGN